MTVRLRPHAFTRRHTIIGVVIVLLVVGGGGTWAVTRSSSSTAATPTLVSVTTSTIRQTVSATGTLEPAHRADLTFAVSGTVTSLPVVVGDKVRSGAVLATVDTSSLKTAVTSAQASVSATQDQLTAQQDAGSSAVQIASTQAQLADAQAKLADSETALAAASMTSPIAGTVAQVNIAVGDKVGGTASAGSSSASGGAGSPSASGGGSSSSSSAGASTSSSTAEIVVISTTSWVVSASVGSADLPQLKKGLQAEIIPSGSATKIFGTVKSVGIIASSSSSGSASFPVTITVTGSPKGVYAGGAATVAIIVKQVENLLSVQTNAVHTEGGKTVVHQMKGGAQVSTPVKVGTTYGAVTQILSGLKAGDKVVGTSFRPGGNRPSGGTGTRQGGGADGGVPGGGGFGGGGFDGPPPGMGGPNG
jgi:multidrug efflux pump subunit AcrA (membrane-fusion protein)